MKRNVYDEHGNLINFELLRIGEVYYTYDKYGVSYRYFDSIEQKLKFVTDKNFNKASAVCEHCGKPVRLINPGMAAEEIREQKKTKVPHVKQYKCDCGKWKTRHIKTGLEFTKNESKANIGIKFKEYLDGDYNKEIFGVIEENGKSFDDKYATYTEEKVLVYYNKNTPTLEWRLFLHNSFINTKQIKELIFTEPYHLLESFGSPILYCKQHIKTSEEHEIMKLFIEVNDKITMLNNIIEQSRQIYKKAMYEKQLDENDLIKIKDNTKTLIFKGTEKNFSEIVEILKTHIKNPVYRLEEDKEIKSKTGEIIRVFKRGELYFDGYALWEKLGNSLGLALKSQTISKKDIKKMIIDPLVNHVGKAVVGQ